jgi:quinoprotein glucose dehydrogenase
MRASTGKLVWSFQAVHHDLWVYDLPSGPSLIEVESKGQRVAALAQPSKIFSFSIVTPASLFCLWKRGRCLRTASPVNGVRPPSPSR